MKPKLMSMTICDYTWTMEITHFHYRDGEVEYGRVW